MSTLSGGPNIVLDSLILDLDAANIKSYPGTGTTWTDISRGGFNATLTNGPTFNSSNGGNIVLDGSNDYISVINGYTNVMKNNNNWTVSLWFRASNLSNNPVLVSPDAGQLAYFDLFLEVGPNAIYWASGGGAGSNYVSATPTLITNTIYNIVFVKTGTTTGKVYLNGIEIALTTNGTGLGSMPNSNADFRIGAFKQSGFELNGNLYNILMYNRTLTASEITQNYNATKGRFGL